MTFADIKPKTSDPKKRAVEWLKLNHVVATLVLQKNMKIRRAVQKKNAIVGWASCANSSETFKRLGDVAEWMGVEPEHVVALMKNLK